MSSSDADDIFEDLGGHHDGKFGFALYRCAYVDDEAWERCVARLTAHVHSGIDKAENGGKIKDHFRWDIFEDKNEFDGASKSKVRQHFTRWRDSVGGSAAQPRYANCIYADQEVIDSVLNGDEPGSMVYEDRHCPRAFVKVLDDPYEEQPSVEDHANDAARAQIDGEDNGMQGTEHCRAEDVEWVKVSARKLIPESLQPADGQRMASGVHASSSDNERLKQQLGKTPGCSFEWPRGTSQCQVVDGFRWA